MSIRVLDIGQCGYDSGQIGGLLTRTFGAMVDHSPTKTDALRRCEQFDYDLILVNRLLDADHSSGLDLIRDFIERGTSVPIMLVSNLKDAQDSAVKLGAVRGFGKAELHTPETASLLRKILDEKPSTSS
jgi:CheY-like chemotaxis protein